MGPGPWTWTRTTLVTHVRAGDFFSVHRYIDPQQESTPWYVNFELPSRRTALGIDTFDVLFDLVCALPGRRAARKFGKMPGMRIEVVRGDITTVNAEVPVTAANSALAGGG